MNKFIEDHFSGGSCGKAALCRNYNDLQFLEQFN
jgi:hypothetical protein